MGKMSDDLRPSRGKNVLIFIIIISSYLPSSPLAFSSSASVARGAALVRASGWWLHRSTRCVQPLFIIGAGQSRPRPSMV